METMALFGHLLLAALLLQPAQDTDHVVQRGDVALHYQTEGKGDVVIVLAGGPGFTPSSVEPVADEIAKEHLAVIIHQRSTGKTELPRVDKAHVSLDQYIEDIDAVRRDLHAEKITLIGHSWGGMLSMAYAGAHPERVSRLILLDSGGANLSFAGVFSDNIESRLTDEDREARATAEKETDYRARGVHRLQAIIPGYFYSRKRALVYAKAIKLEDYDPRVGTLLISNFDVTKALGNYKDPVALVQGRQDPIDAYTVELNKKYLPQAKIYWIERAGHMPWAENPKDFEAALEHAIED